MRDSAGLPQFPIDDDAVVTRDCSIKPFPYVLAPKVDNGFVAVRSELVSIGCDKAEVQGQGKIIAVDI
jgi:hypothetical protein